jgi:hypothetical protein
MKRQGKYKNTGNDNQDNALTTRKLSKAKASVSTVINQRVIQNSSGTLGFKRRKSSLIIFRGLVMPENPSFVTQSIQLGWDRS